MLAGFECIDRDGGVAGVRGADVDGFDFVHREEIVVIFEDFGAFDAVFAGRFFSAFADDVAECDHLDIFDGFQTGEVFPVCNAAAADDTDFHRSHVSFLRLLCVRCTRQEVDSTSIAYPAGECNPFFERQSKMSAQKRAVF